MAEARRRPLALLLGTTLLAGCVDWLGGNFRGDPEDAEFLLSPSAQALIDTAYADVEAGELRDFHTHVLAQHGADGWWNPTLLDWRRPLERLRSLVYFSAAGIDDRARAQEQYLARLVRLVRSQPRPGRHFLLAMDQVHDDDGRPRPQDTPYTVSNDYVLRLAQRHPDIFSPAISVHPYRADALAEIDRWADAGVRLMKWLPNVQDFDPADPRLAPHYALMAQRGMVLLSHAGKERALDAVASQEWGNPLRLRPALDAGVTVLVAHAAGLGESADLDQELQPPVDNFDLLLRMMDKPDYEGRLFAELSATTQFNRVPTALAGLLQRPQLFHRLVNGSDYPLPAVNVTIHLDRLVEHGFIDPAEADPLREIYGYNPLMFDYVLKRRLRLPGTDLRLPATVFRGDSVFGT